MLEKRLGCRKSTIFFTDQDFHDHLALLLNYMEQAQLFFTEIGNCRGNHWATYLLPEDGIYDVQSS